MRKPMMDVAIFKERRERLAKLIPGCALVLPAQPEAARNHHHYFAYRANSNLFYLSGFDEPESCLIFRPGRSPETVLFVRPKNESKETWDGFRYGPKGAKELFGVDEAYPIEQLETVAPELLRGSERVYYSLFRDKEFDQRFGKVMLLTRGERPRAGIGIPAVEDAYPLMGELRMKKSEVEAEIMRKAAQIGAEAHIEVMKATRPGVNERALHGLFIKAIMERGATTESYGGIFAGGANSTYLHYHFNENVLQDGEVLLVDAGAEYLLYASDITRTYPVNGKFNSAQKRLYGKVLALQKRIIQMVQPGLPHFDMQKETVSGLVDIMLEEKLLKGQKEDLISSMAYTKYYPHGVSHMLGLDTHDAGLLVTRGQSRPMEAGWVFTVEPGIYIPPHDVDAPSELRGIGIRIEDDVLVTHDGVEVLTKGAPKEVEELEALIGQA